MIDFFQSYLPDLLRDRSNVLAQSYSGSGKGITMAALLLSNVKENIKYPHIVGVVPTNAAALQLNKMVLAMMGRNKIYTVHVAVTGKNGKYFYYS